MSPGQAALPANADKDTSSFGDLGGDELGGKRLEVSPSHHWGCVISLAVWLITRVLVLWLVSPQAPHLIAVSLQ